jgi:hypothetical protein
VVWAWVPFEEDSSRGKDRPVLVIARRGSRLLGLMLTSKDHDRDAEQEARHGRFWLDLGLGGWDRENRPSEVRLDRILQLDPAAVGLQPRAAVAEQSGEPHRRLRMAEIGRAHVPARGLLHVLLHALAILIEPAERILRIHLRALNELRRIGTERRAVELGCQVELGGDPVIGGRLLVIGRSGGA